MQKAYATQYLYCQLDIGFANKRDFEQFKALPDLFKNKLKEIFKGDTVNVEYEYNDSQEDYWCTVDLNIEHDAEITPGSKGSLECPPEPATVDLIDFQYGSPIFTPQNGVYSAMSQFLSNLYNLKGEVTIDMVEEEVDDEDRVFDRAWEELLEDDYYDEDETEAMYRGYPW